ncbi:MAG: F0F1 ATP synthase subunit B [Microgenomates group bacterium]|jgi:F-type H+-transporting ATPase subunit b
MEILDQFGIKPILLLAQIVNFIILLLILKKFLYKPILKILEERKEKIAEGLANAEEIEKKLAQIIEDRDKKLEAAAKESKKVIDEAMKSANQIIAESHEKALEQTKKMIAKSEEQMALEREKLHMEIRSEIADLVALGLEKTASKVLSAKDKEELSKSALKGFEK